MTCLLTGQVYPHTNMEMKDTLHKYTVQVHTFDGAMKKKTTVFNIHLNRLGQHLWRRKRLNERALKKKKKKTPTHFPIQWSFSKCSSQ